jgi:hypothetical protein
MNDDFSKIQQNKNKNKIYVEATHLLWYLMD